MSFSIITRALRPVCGCLAVALLVSAPAANAAPGWTNWGEITEFVQGFPAAPSSEMVYFVASVTANPATCTYAGGFYFPVSDERQKRMFAMLLAAKMAGKRVQVYTDGSCHPGAAQGYGHALALGVVIE